MRAIITLKVEPSKVREVATYLARYRNIHYVAQCTGDYNLIFWVLCPTISDLARFIKAELNSLSGVRASNTVIEVEPFKRTYDWLPAEDLES